MLGVRMKRRKPPAVKVSRPSPAQNRDVKLGFSPDAQTVYNLLPQKVKDGLDDKLREFGKDENAGKPLIRKLKGYHRVTYGRVRAISLRAIANVTAGIVVVYTLSIGPRKEGASDDPYAQATAALKRRDPEVITALENLVAQAINSDQEDDDI